MLFNQIFCFGAKKALFSKNNKYVDLESYYPDLKSFFTKNWSRLRSLEGKYAFYFLFFTHFFIIFCS